MQVDSNKLKSEVKALQLTLETATWSATSRNGLNSCKTSAWMAIAIPRGWRVTFELSGSDSSAALYLEKSSQILFLFPQFSETMPSDQMDTLIATRFVLDQARQRTRPLGTTVLYNISIAASIFYFCSQCKYSSDSCV